MNLRHAMRRVGAGAVLASALVSPPLAALEIIFDNGRTQPLVIEGASRPAPAPTPQPQPYSLARLFPVRSPSLTPGSPPPLAPEARARLQQLARPLFLLGSDAASLAWLSAHRERLRELGAIGFVVEAATLADFNTVIIAAGPGLTVVPSSGEALARVLGLAHYPVLITREGLLR